MSLVVYVAGAKALEQGSMLFNLPRELRDEIYRYLVKGNHFVGGQSDFPGYTSSHTYGEGGTPEKMMDDLNCDVLRVSKTVSHEAMSVLYSESTFRFEVDFFAETVRLPPQSVVERMMNIELNVTVGIHVAVERFKSPSSLFMEHMRETWKDTLGCITRTKTVRNTLRIRFGLLFSSDIKKAIPEWMYRRLKALSQFRTVVLELKPKLQRHEINGVVWLETEKSEETLESLEWKVEDLKGYLEPPLGPAVTGHVYSPGHQHYAKTLTFRPQENMPTILRGRAKRLRAKADILDLKAEEAEAGS